jgi:hypothetical protein
VKSGIRNRLDIVASAGTRAVGAVLATVPSGPEIFRRVRSPRGLARRERKLRPPAVWGHLAEKANRMTPQPINAPAVR